MGTLNLRGIGGPLGEGSATRWREIGGFMPIKKPRGLRGLVLLAKEWSGNSGLLARAAAHRNHGEGESAEEETVGRGLRDGGDFGDDPRTVGGAA
jgi:hypothetical protein